MAWPHEHGGSGLRPRRPLRTTALELEEATSRAEDGVSTLIVVMTESEEQRTVVTAVRPELGWPAMAVVVLRWFTAHVGENGDGMRWLQGQGGRASGGSWLEACSTAAVA